MPDDNKIVWQRIDEQSGRLRTVETDTAILINDTKTNKESIKDLDQRFIEHTVKTETTTEQLIQNVHAMKEDFSGFRGEIKGSIASLKIIVPISVAAVGGILSGLAWLLTTFGNGVGTG